MKDEAPGEEGGRRRLSARVPCSQRCHYCVPRPPPRPAAATRPQTRGCRPVARSPRRALTCCCGKHSEARPRAAQSGGRRKWEKGLVTEFAPPRSSAAPGFLRPTPSRLCLLPRPNPPLRMQWYRPRYGKRRRPGLVRLRRAAEAGDCRDWRPAELAGSQAVMLLNSGDSVPSLPGDYYNDVSERCFQQKPFPLSCFRSV